MISPRPFLTGLFQAAVDAAQPALCIPPNLPPKPRGRTVVIGAGKASAAMARALETHWDGPLSGLVVTRYGHRVDCDRIEIVEASHPVPDAAGAAAARGILERIAGLTEDDLVICLISGGGSALMTLPMPGITLEDKIAVNRALLRSGANISEMNCIRKHLSAIKGGRLAAAAAPARIVTLAISDVPGDDPAVIASGPTVPDPTSFAEAREILARYGVVPPEPVGAFLQRAAEETPKPGDSRLVNSETVLVAAPQASLEAAAAVARKAGVTPVILGDAIEGESREVATVFAGIAHQVARHGQPAAAPAGLSGRAQPVLAMHGGLSRDRDCRRPVQLWPHPLTRARHRVARRLRQIVHRAQRADHRVHQTLEHLVAIPVQDCRIGHQVTDIAQQQHRSALERQRRAICRHVLSIRVQPARHDLTALLECVLQVARQQTQPVSIGQNLVIGVNGSDGVFQIDDRRDRRFDQDV